MNFIMLSIRDYMFSNSRCLTGSSYLSFFFIHTATTELYTLSLHDALPISAVVHTLIPPVPFPPVAVAQAVIRGAPGDRKSTRLNSSHRTISYAVFCLK